MADGFDRSWFVLDMMDYNLLYKDRLVGGGSLYHRHLLTFYSVCRER